MAYEHVPLTYQGVPLGSPVGAPTGSPQCWGSGYNSEDRTCRACGFQASCRTEVIRKDLAARPVGAQQPPPSPVYSTPPQYAAQQRIPITQPGNYYQPQPVPTYPNAQRYASPQPQQTQHQPPQPLKPPPAQYGYGSVYDPMFYALASVPEPFRPQVQGESFLERILKNMVLAGIGAVLKEALLGERQLYWWPNQKLFPGSASNQVVDVGPQRV